MSIRFNIAGKTFQQPTLDGKDGQIARKNMLDLIKDHTPVGAAWRAEEQRKKDIDKAWAQHSRAA